MFDPWGSIQVAAEAVAAATAENVCYLEVIRTPAAGMACSGTVIAMADGCLMTTWCILNVPEAWMQDAKDNAVASIHGQDQLLDGCGKRSGAIFFFIERPQNTPSIRRSIPEDMK